MPRPVGRWFAVPSGKVKWYDAEKGFGFLSREDGEDVYVRASALPEGEDVPRDGALPGSALYGLRCSLLP